MLTTETDINAMTSLSLAIPKTIVSA